jgi:hypothetical protein
MKTIKYRVWTILSTDEDLLEEEFSKESLEAQQDAVKYAHILWMQFNDYQLHMHETFNRIKKFMEDNPDSESSFKDLIKDHPEKEALEFLFDNKDIDHIIWNKLKPELE